MDICLNHEEVNDNNDDEDVVRVNALINRNTERWRMIILI